MKLATLCYVQAKGRTLMMHRVKKAHDIHEGKWNGLGGKMEPGETPEECVIRELKEESGLDIRNPQLRGVLTFPGFANGEDWYVFVFVAPEFSGDLIDCDEGNLEWVEDSKIMELELWEGDRIFLPWLSQDKFFSGKFVYKRGKLIDYSEVFHA